MTKLNEEMVQLYVSIFLLYNVKGSWVNQISLNISLLTVFISLKLGSHVSLSVKTLSDFYSQNKSSMNMTAVSP